jgi:hypothetical protein
VLSSLVAGLLVAYWHHYRRRYRLVGHLFQGRCRTPAVDADAYLSVAAVTSSATRWPPGSRPRHGNTAGRAAAPTPWANPTHSWHQTPGTSNWRERRASGRSAGGSSCWPRIQRSRWCGAMIG